MGKFFGSEDAQHSVQDVSITAVVQAAGGGIERSMNALKNLVAAVKRAKESEETVPQDGSGGQQLQWFWNRRIAEG